MEESCKFVSINGIARTCDVYPINIIHNSENFVKEDYDGIKDGNSVFIVTNCIKHFVREVLPGIKENGLRIKVVTGASDIGVPNHLDRMDDKTYLAVFGDSLIHWFTQNFDNPTDISEYTCIPLGMDYHTNAEISPRDQEKKLIEIYKKSGSFSERRSKSLSCFQFRLFSDKSQDKWKAMEALNELSFNDVLTERRDREYLWKLMAKYKFIICPCSSGIDTNLIYESILLGCEPITKRGTISHMLIDLPVLIINDWTELSESIWDVFKDFGKFREINKETIHLEYWTELIKEQQM